MPKEIEYKFTVVSDDWRKGINGIDYKQGYLNIEQGRTVRVRIEGDKGKLTIKGKKIGPEGAEFEYNIPLEDAEYLIEYMCIKPLIEKKRYKIEFADKTWEVDEFYGENEGLVFAEIELTGAGEPFEKPYWIGRDVTEDVKYKNANLVNYPFRKWSEAEKKTHYLK
ncbi:MAG: CYTH domain-containing protein [Ignavibacteriaceae bacterium]|nr:CYTH domain-containing protein [Ignavibacteriaceae bacterium]